MRDRCAIRLGAVGWSGLAPTPRNDRLPDPGYTADMASCLRDSAHVRLLVGLMQQNGVRFVAVDGESNHGIPFSAIVVQGQPDVSVLQQVARKMAEMLDAERDRLRLIAERQ